MSRSSDSSDSDGESERLKEAVYNLKSLKPVSVKASSQCTTDEASSSKQLDVSRETQKFLAKKLSKYLDSVLEELSCSEDEEDGTLEVPEKFEKEAVSGVRLLERSTCPLLLGPQEPTNTKRKKKAPPPVPHSQSSDSDEDDQNEREKLSAAAIDAQVIKKQRLT